MKTSTGPETGGNTSNKVMGLWAIGKGGPKGFQEEPWRFANAKTRANAQKEGRLKKIRSTKRAGKEKGKKKERRKKKRDERERTRGKTTFFTTGQQAFIGPKSPLLGPKGPLWRHHSPWWGSDKPLNLFLNFDEKMCTTFLFWISSWLLLK